MQIANFTTKRFGVLCLTAAALLATPAHGAPLPNAVGKCSITTIKQVGYQLGVPGSGSAVSFANGGDQVSYDTIAGIVHSRPGDRVKMCLVALPRNCPSGDTRGRTYRTTNFRTRESWTAAEFPTHLRRRIEQSPITHLPIGSDREAQRIWQRRCVK